MPEFDGIQLFTFLRSDPATVYIPVIFFTANAEKLLFLVANDEQWGAML